MSDWILIPAGVSLRTEFNELNPNRDKGADGSIGDSAHTSSSDHTPDEDSDVLRDHDADNKNEVHAVDIDSSGPWPGSGTQKERFHRIVMGIIAREKARWLDPDDVCRLEYVIWDRKIYSRSRDFNPVAYTGSDPHTNHAHFSFRYLTTSENDTRSWGIAEEDDGMAEITQARFNQLMSGYLGTEEGKSLVGDAAIKALDANLNTATTASPSLIVRNLRRISVQYPFGDGTTVQGVFEQLKTFLGRQLDPAEQTTKK